MQGGKGGTQRVWEGPIGFESVYRIQESKEGSIGSHGIYRTGREWGIYRVQGDL